MSGTKPKTVSILTLGCRLNQTDSALLQADLQEHGFDLVTWGKPADILIVNSCTVTAAAAAKTRKGVRAARRRFPNAWVVVLGCDVDMDPEEWRAGMGADVVGGNGAKRSLGKLLASIDGRSLGPVLPPTVVATGSGRDEDFREAGVGAYPERTRACLKVQEGCDFGCSYCIVPQVRGPSRSRDWEDALREAQALVARGHRELVMTGVNIADYRHGGRNLADLLEAILGLGEGFRIRLGSIEPTPVVYQVVRLMASSGGRLCRFLHLPLQYGDDRILRAMGRSCSVAEYRSIAACAAEAVPGLCLGTDIITGFPGETDASFSSCCRAIESLPISHLHVFTYSPRRGTPAADMADQVPGDLASRRAAALERIGVAKASAFAAAQIGEALEVVTERRNARGAWEGWSDNYLRVELDSQAPLAANRLVRAVVLATAGERCLRAAVLPAPPENRPEPDHGVS